ncbi:MAG TPA: HlyD family efflux transporter periplasmic adaptor subunit [Flavisolibacter sp.]|nr:HlyD family efflux transporter periplasmic adaptor subunit [Flavisolibacter sp.]
MPSAIHSQQHSEELVSNEVREIISYRPHWMIRRGNLVFLGVLLLLLFLTLFVRYPDVVNATARLVAVNAPKTALAHTEGKLTAIYISQGQQVKKGQHLAAVESTASYAEVMKVKDWITNVIVEVQTGNFENLAFSTPADYPSLGELQRPYQTFSNEWNELRQFFGSGYYQKKKAALLQDIAFMHELKENIRLQEDLSIQEWQLQQAEFAAYDSLAKDKLVAPLEVNKYKAALLLKEQSLAQTKSETINNDVSVHNKQKELTDLQKQVMDQQQKIFTALLLLKSETEEWIQKYIVTAPEEGTVYFAAPLQPAEQVSAGQELFYVQPEAISYYAQLMAGQGGLGKVKEGQKVKLKIENYPSEEYGYLKGVVSSIASFPNRRDSFLVQVQLPDGLKTIYRKELFFRNNMLAGAEIITDDRKLFDRFFDPLRKLLFQ